METNTYQRIIVGLIVGLVVIFILSYILSPKSPQIVVNMPANAQPLEQLTDKVVVADAKVIDNEKAILWWTVFKFSADKGYSPGYSVNCADSAVEKVYGKN